MKIIITALLFFVALQFANAQIFAVTEIGDEVVLYENGTWRYVNDSLMKKTGAIPLNETFFEKGKKSSFLVKSKKVNVGVYIDPKRWNFSKLDENSAAEFQFQEKGEDVYAMIIAEKIQIPIESLKTIAFQNAKNAAPDAEIVSEEYRIVNGIKVIAMQMAGTVQGMRFTYFGYYFSNENGSIQFLAYTGENLFEHYKEDIELLLNGLVEL